MQTRNKELTYQEFISFTTSIEIDENNFLIENRLDSDFELISRYYTPQNRINEATRQVVTEFKRQHKEFKGHNLEEGRLAYNVLRSNILHEYKKLTPYFRLVLLESYVITLVTQEPNSYIKYVEDTDISNIQESIKYVLNILGMDLRYKEIIKQLNDLNIDLGYIKAQLPVIHNDLKVVD